MKYIILIDGFNLSRKFYHSFAAAQADLPSALRRCQYDARICEVSQRDYENGYEAQIVDEMDD